MRCCARSRATIVSGFMRGSFFERVPGENRAFNTTVVFDRDGREVARYRKIHMFDITAPDGTKYQESATMKPGEAVVTYDCEGVTIGCTICYDLRFAELFAALVERGASIIALPAAFTLQTGKDHWEVLLRARAIETQTYVLAAAQIGSVQSQGQDAAQLRALHGGRPLGPCGRAGLGRDRHRLIAARSRVAGRGARPDAGGPASPLGPPGRGHGDRGGVGRSPQPQLHHPPRKGERDRAVSAVSCAALVSCASLGKSRPEGEDDRCHRRTRRETA